ncbi:MAG TPA: helix-turn-helix domain-containing protein [Dehalococcoidia bacterium]|nr:helix-turn-helix domain-containing protein [Dehalococcoidia bacterium]
MATRKILTPRQVAEYLQLDEATVYRYIREGKLLASKLGRQYRIPKENVDLLLTATATPRALQLRRYSRERIEEFLKEDEIDEETREKAERLLTALSAPAS